MKKLADVALLQGDEKSVDTNNLFITVFLKSAFKMLNLAAITSLNHNSKIITTHLHKLPLPTAWWFKDVVALIFLN